MTKSTTVLVINAGSSSIKVALCSPDSTQPLLEASVTGVNQTNAQLHTQEGSKQLIQDDTASAIQAIIQWLNSILDTTSLAAIGHRIVHGGLHYHRPVVIMEDIEQDLTQLIPFDPEHLPAALQLIQAMREQFPEVPQVACFDTAFFHDLPQIAQTIPLPAQYTNHGVRRYGFHGLSYTYLLSALQDAAGEEAANGRLILAHLGSGASLAAIHHGKPVDTTMGLTPASGIVMSSRSGDLDPGIASYLSSQWDVTPQQFGHIVNFESGLLGVSGLSADMYTLLQQETTNEQARLAVDLFCYQARKAIGALAASLGGVDTLVFSGGIGEQSAIIRDRICEGLEFLGLKLDSSQNDQQAAVISSPESRVTIRVIPTNEAHAIATQTIQTLSH
jgi:acetate kinase